MHNTRNVCLVNGLNFDSNKMNVPKRKGNDSRSGSFGSLDLNVFLSLFMSRIWAGGILGLSQRWRVSDTQTHLETGADVEPEAVDSFVISWGTPLTFIIIKVMEELHVFSLNSQLQAFSFISRNYNCGFVPVHISLLCSRSQRFTLDMKPFLKNRSCEHTAFQDNSC